MVTCRRFPVGTDQKDVKPRQAEPVSTKYRTDNTQGESAALPIDDLCSMWNV